MRCKHKKKWEHYRKDSYICNRDHNFCGVYRIFEYGYIETWKWCRIKWRILIYFLYFF